MRRLWLIYPLLLILYFFYSLFMIDCGSIEFWGFIDLALSAEESFLWASILGLLWVSVYEPPYLN